MKLRLQTSSKKLIENQAEIYQWQKHEWQGVQLLISNLKIISKHSKFSIFFQTPAQCLLKISDPIELSKKFQTPSSFASAPVPVILYDCSLTVTISLMLSSNKVVCFRCYYLFGLNFVIQWHIIMYSSISRN